MKRVIPFAILFLFLGGLTGCRVPVFNTSNLVPAFVNRPNDYRGTDDLYRAGSIFGSEYPDNVGSFGQTEPIDHTYQQQIIPRTREEGSNQRTETADDIRRQSKERVVPREYLPPIPVPTPIDPQPPFQPLPNVPNVPDEPEEAFPGSGSGRLRPQMSLPHPIIGEPIITEETLRLLDPSVSEIKILNIEDSVL